MQALHLERNQAVYLEQIAMPALQNKHHASASFHDGAAAEIVVKASAGGGTTHKQTRPFKRHSVVHPMRASEPGHISHIV